MYRSAGRGVRDYTGILSIALVCKAWKSVTEVYFKQIGSPLGPVQPIHNIRGLVESLKCQPRMCEHIRAFCSFKVADHPKFYNRCADMINICSSLEDLRISHQVYWLAKTGLAKLVHLQSLDISYPTGPDAMERVDTILEVYDVIKSWRRLEKLNVTVPSIPSSEKLW